MLRYFEIIWFVLCLHFLKHDLFHTTHTGCDYIYVDSLRSCVILTQIIRKKVALSSLSFVFEWATTEGI